MLSIKIILIQFTEGFYNKFNELTPLRLDLKASTCYEKFWPVMMNRDLLRRSEKYI